MVERERGVSAPPRAGPRLGAGGRSCSCQGGGRRGREGSAQSPHGLFGRADARVEALDPPVARLPAVEPRGSRRRGAPAHVLGRGLRAHLLPLGLLLDGAVLLVGREGPIFGRGPAARQGGERETERGGLRGGHDGGEHTVAEAHRNRTCPRQRNCPAPILKTGGGTSRPRASAGLFTRARGAAPGPQRASAPAPPRREIR